MSSALDSVFYRAEVFNYNEVRLIIPFMDHVFGVLTRKITTDPKSSRFSPMISSRSPIILHFTFRFIILFELVFVKGVSSECKFIFLPKGRDA